MSAPVAIRPNQLASPHRLDVWRCPKCGRILAKLHLAAGSMVEVKCGSCNNVAVREAA